MHFRTGWMLAVVVNAVVAYMAMLLLRNPLEDFRKYTLGIGCDYTNGEWYCAEGVGAGLADLRLQLNATAISLALVLIVVTLLTKSYQRFRLARDLRLVAAIVFAATLPLSLSTIGGWAATGGANLPAVLVHTGIVITLLTTLKERNRTRTLVILGAAIAAAAYIGSEDLFLGFAMPSAIAFLVASSIATIRAVPRRADEPATGLVAILVTAGR